MTIHEDDTVSNRQRQIEDEILALADEIRRRRQQDALRELARLGQEFDRDVDGKA